MAYEYRINQVTFSDETVVSLGRLTVLVGPNNCGKSRALKDLVSLTCSIRKSGVVATDVIATYPPDAKILATAYPTLPRCRPILVMRCPF